MILKNADTISIEGKDVQRIKMFNDVVWEKIKTTTLSLTSSTTSTSFVNSFTLTATLKESASQAPVSGTIDFYDGNTKIGSSNTVIKNNVATATFTTSSQSIGTHQYNAKFNGTKKHKASQSGNRAISINKDTPKLTRLGSTTNIYNSWDVGVKLTNSKGSAISNRQIYYTSSSHKATNSSGKAIINISGKTEGSTYTVTFNFKGDSYYNSVSLKQSYKIQKPASKSLSLNSLTQGAGGPSNSDCSTCKNANKTGPRQKWDVLDKNSWSRCGRQNCYCKMIGTASGTWKRPAVLTATFGKISGTIKSLSCSYSDQYDKGYSSGGYPSIGAPTLTSNTYGSSKTSGKPKKASYGSHTVEWSGSKTMSSNPTIKFDYPANTAGETGLIYIKNIKLTAHYIPSKESL